MAEDRNEALSWIAANEKGAALVVEEVERGRSFDDIGAEWLAGVEAGRISRWRGRGRPYSETTIADYRRSYQGYLEPEFGPMVDEESVRWSGRCGSTGSQSEGRSRSRIESHVAVASAIDAWALTPSRRFVTRNPLRLVELPPNDEKPRLRVAFARTRQRRVPPVCAPPPSCRVQADVGMIERPCPARHRHGVAYGVRARTLRWP